MTIKIFFLALVFCSRFAFAGGSVIGNGAGLVENNFQYSYSMIPSMVAACLASSRCLLSSKEKSLLEKISDVAASKASNAARLRFISESEQPGTFDVGLGEKHRIAKTGLSTGDPIDVNTDLLYHETGKPRLDYPTIISILIHELGHQTGEADHALLDILGAKIRAVAYDKTSPYSIQMENGDQITVTILNTDRPTRTAELYFSWQSVGSAKVTSQLTQGMACSNQHANFNELEITNGAFFLTRPFSDATISDVGFSVWVRIFCAIKENSTTTVESYAVRAKIKKDLTLEILAREKLR